jgi:hypothetical protein
MQLILMMHEIHRHMEPEELERYSLGYTTAVETERIEEHLLVCEQCREKLDETEGFAIAMKAAATQLDRKSWRPGWISIVAAAACLVLSVGLALRWHSNPQPAFAVNLAATRSLATVAAPAGRALELHPDLTGLTASPAYRLELVNQTGSQVWRGDLGGQAAVTVPAQSSGTYFIRIYTQSGELLREYGLKIGT